MYVYRGYDVLLDRGIIKTFGLDLKEDLFDNLFSYLGCFLQKTGEQRAFWLFGRRDLRRWRKNSYPYCINGLKNTHAEKQKPDCLNDNKKKPALCITQS